MALNQIIFISSSTPRFVISPAHIRMTDVVTLRAFIHLQRTLVSKSAYSTLRENVNNNTFYGLNIHSSTPPASWDIKSFIIRE